MDVHWKAVDGFPLDGPSRISNGCTVAVLAIYGRFLDIHWIVYGSVPMDKHSGPIQWMYF